MKDDEVFWTASTNGTKSILVTFEHVQHRTVDVDFANSCSWVSEWNGFLATTISKQAAMLCFRVQTCTYKVSICKDTKSNCIETVRMLAFRLLIAGAQMVAGKDKLWMFYLAFLRLRSIKSPSLLPVFLITLLLNEVSYLVGRASLFQTQFHIWQYPFCKHYEGAVYTLKCFLTIVPPYCFVRCYQPVGATTQRKQIV